MRFPSPTPIGPLPETKLCTGHLVKVQKRPLPNYLDRNRSGYRVDQAPNRHLVRV